MLNVFTSYLIYEVSSFELAFNFLSVFKLIIIFLRPLILYFYFKGFAPDIKSKIINSELLTPKDIEKRFVCTGGHWHHGEISLDQVMMMRPFPGASQYRTSVDGLFLCGAGTHPGGGVMGLSGINAAKEIIKGGIK